MRNFAWYGRLSTKDKQDPTLSFPSQREACATNRQRKRRTSTPRRSISTPTRSFIYLRFALSR